MGTCISAFKTSVLIALGYAAAGLSGCGDNNSNSAGQDDSVASTAAEVVVTPAACPATMPLTDIFVKSMGVMIFDEQGRLADRDDSSKNAPYRTYDFVADGRPLCLKGKPFPLDLHDVKVASRPAKVYVSLEGSIGQCGLAPDDPVPIFTVTRSGGPFLMAECEPKNKVTQSSVSTCTLPPLTPSDFNYCVR